MAEYPDYDNNYPHSEVTNNVEVAIATLEPNTRMAFVTGVGKSAFTVANNGSYMKPLPFKTGITYNLSTYIGISDYILSNFVSDTDLSVVTSSDVASDVLEDNITFTKNANNVWQFTLSEDRTDTNSLYLTIPTAITIDYNDTSLASSLRTLKIVNSLPLVKYYYGVVSQDNPIAFACSIMLTAGGDGVKFYTDSVAADTPANYTASLRKAATNKAVRHVTLLTHDEDCREVLTTHIAYTDDSIVQRWRTGFVTTSSTNANDVVALAESYNDENIVVVHALDGAYYASTDALGVTTEYDLPTYYIAAGISAYMTTQLPHQGISTVELDWISSVPSSNTDYYIEDINAIAKYGVLVIRQDAEGTSPIIHHQMTTNAANGDLYAELSCTVNIQDINHTMADVVAEYYGKYSLYSDVTSHIKDALQNKFKELSTTEKTDAYTKAGPQVLSYANISVAKDESYNSHVSATADIEISTIANVVKLTINTYLGI